MYTNMYINELIEAVSNVYDNIQPNDYCIPLISREYFLKIMELILKTNEFEFAGNYYIQKIGCAMGARSSPQICDIRAYEFINNIINKFEYSNDIILHHRFRDDGLILFNGGVDKLKELFEIANNEHELLKFTYEYSMTSNDFLDITLYKGERFFLY